MSPIKKRLERGKSRKEKVILVFLIIDWLTTFGMIHGNEPRHQNDALLVDVQLRHHTRHAVEVDLHHRHLVRHVLQDQGHALFQLRDQSHARRHGLSADLLVAVLHKHHQGRHPGQCHAQKHLHQRVTDRVHLVVVAPGKIDT